MNVISFISVLAFGLSMISIGKRGMITGDKKLNSIMRWISFCIAWWLLCASQFYEAQTKEIAWMWHKLSSIGCITVIPLISMYFIYMSGNGKKLEKTGNLILFWFPVALLMAITLFGPTTPYAYDLVQSSIGYGWTYFNKVDSTLLWSYMIFLITYIGYSFLLFNRITKIERFKFKRNLFVFFMVLDTFIVFIGVVTDVILPMYTNYFVPTANISFVIFIVGYLYISKKYDTKHVERYISSELIFNTSTAAFLVLDEKGKIFYSNSKVCDILQVSKEEIINYDYKSIIVKDEEFKKLLEDLKVSKTIYDRILHVIIKDKKYSLTFSIDEVFNDKNKFQGYVVSFMDVTKIVEANKMFEELASTDEATKLLNRRSAFRDIKLLSERYEKYNTNFALMFIELHNLKSVNYKYGHLEGNKLLCDISNIIKEILKNNEKLYRFDGDQFVILVSSNNLIKRVNELDESLKIVIHNNPIFLNYKDCHIKITFGCNLYSESKDFDDFINTAEKNLHHFIK